MLSDPTIKPPFGTVQNRPNDFSPISTREPGRYVMKLSAPVRYHCSMLSALNTQYCPPIAAPRRITSSRCSAVAKSSPSYVSASATPDHWTRRPLRSVTMVRCPMNDTDPISVNAPVSGTVRVVPSNTNRSPPAATVTLPLLLLIEVCASLIISPVRYSAPVLSIR